VNFVEYNPRYFFQDFGAAVEHSAENLGGHDETRGVRGERDVAGHEADVGELLAELTVLLVAEGLERGRVDDALPVAEGHGNGVFGDGGFAGRGVGGDENGLVALQTRDGDLLEGVEGEGIGLRHGTVVERVRESSVELGVLVRDVTARNGDLVNARAFSAASSFRLRSSVWDCNWEFRFSSLSQ